MAERWTLRGRMTFWPAWTEAKIIVWTAAVVPLTMKKALSAPKASAARACASRMTETGCARLSRGFMELTSSDISFVPKYSLRAGSMRPPLWPGTSKCARRLTRCSSSARATGASC